MSDKAEKKEEGKEGTAKKAPIWTKLPVLLGGVMVVEAAVLFGLFKVLGGSPKPAAAETELATGEAGHGEAGGHGGGGHGGATSRPSGALAELEVTAFRAPNMQGGRRLIYDVAIFAAVKEANKEKVEATLKARKATVEDRVRTIIAQSEPDKLGGGVEPGLETLRRQVKFQLEEIVGEGLIEEILIPRCIPFRGD